MVQCRCPATSTEIIASIDFSLTSVTLMILVITDIEPGGFPRMLVWIWIITRLIVITPSSRPIGSLRRKIWAGMGLLKLRGSLGLQSCVPLVPRASQLTRYHARDFVRLFICIAGFVWLIKISFVWLIKSLTLLSPSLFILICLQYLMGEGGKMFSCYRGKVSLLKGKFSPVWRQNVSILEEETFPVWGAELYRVVSSARALQ